MSSSQGMCAFCCGQCTTSAARCTCGSAPKNLPPLPPLDTPSLFRMPSLTNKSAGGSARRKRKAIGGVGAAKELQQRKSSDGSSSRHNGGGHHSQHSSRQSSQIFRGLDPPLPLEQMQALLGDRRIDVHSWALLQTRHRIMDNLARAPSEEVKRQTLLQLADEMDALNPPSHILSQIANQLLSAFFPTDFYRRLQQKNALAQAQAAQLPPQMPPLPPPMITAAAATVVRQEAPLPPLLLPPANQRPTLPTGAFVQVQNVRSVPSSPHMFSPIVVQQAGQPFRAGDLNLGISLSAQTSPISAQQPVIPLIRTAQPLQNTSSLLLPQALLPQLFLPKETERLAAPSSSSVTSASPLTDPVDALFRNELIKHRNQFFSQNPPSIAAESPDPVVISSPLSMPPIFPPSLTSQTVALPSFFTPSPTLQLPAPQPTPFFFDSQQPMVFQSPSLTQPP